MRAHCSIDEKRSEYVYSDRENGHLDATKSQTIAIDHVSIANRAINRLLKDRLLEANPIDARR